MKHYITLIFFASLLIILNTSCNENKKGESTEAATPDSSSTLQNLTKAAEDSLNAIKQINDSFNLAIDKLSESIKTLYDSANQSTDPKRKLLLDQRKTMIDVQQEAINSRNNVTSEAIIVLQNKLQPVIQTLKTKLFKLSRLSDRIENIISILTVVDKAIQSALAAGTLHPPIILQ